MKTFQVQEAGAKIGQEDTRSGVISARTAAGAEEGKIHQLSTSEVEQVSGAMMYPGLSWLGVAFVAGYSIGTAIDQKFIKGLWK